MIPANLSPDISATCMSLMYTLTCWVMLFSPSPLSLTHFSHLLAVKAIIEHEIKNGIPPSRIILGGFSQVSTGTPIPAPKTPLTGSWA